MAGGNTGDNDLQGREETKTGEQNDGDRVCTEHAHAHALPSSVSAHVDDGGGSMPNVQNKEAFYRLNSTNVIGASQTRRE